jgi:hypothetical protein
MMRDWVVHKDVMVVVWIVGKKAENSHTGVVVLSRTSGDIVHHEVIERNLLPHEVNELVESYSQW